MSQFDQLEIYFEQCLQVGKIYGMAKSQVITTLIVQTNYSVTYENSLVTVLLANLIMSDSPLGKLITVIYILFNLLRLGE